MGLSGTEGITGPSHRVRASLQMKLVMFTYASLPKPASWLWLIMLLRRPGGCTQRKLLEEGHMVTIS